eukprot:398194-Pyramimonas_sp.AAC.1
MSLHTPCSAHSDVAPRDVREDAGLRRHPELTQRVIPSYSYLRCFTGRVSSWRCLNAVVAYMIFLWGSLSASYGGTRVCVELFQRSACARRRPPGPPVPPRVWREFWLNASCAIDICCRSCYVCTSHVPLTVLYLVLEHSMACMLRNG